MSQKDPIQKTEDEEPIRRVPATRYSPDYKEGLSPEQVREHQEQGWSNRAVEAPSKTTRDIIRENVFTYFNLIFAILGVLLCVVGSFRDLTFPAGHHFQYADRYRPGDQGQAGAG